MTLALTVIGPESIWMLTDRRLSTKGRPPKDDARKVMLFEATDGVAILGYAGLGATARGTEPADWMSAVLRGRNFPLEQSLRILASAMKKEFPRHMVRMPGDQGPAHCVIIPALLGNEPRLYSIDLAFARDRKNYSFRYTRHVVNNTPPPIARTPRVAIAGSGLLYLSQDKKWIRTLLRVVRAHDRGHVSQHAVADHLANLNNEVHLGMGDKSVGPRCVVAWRHRRGGVHKGGGGHLFYTNTTRETNSPALPSIITGMDMEALTSVLMPRVTKMFEAMEIGHPPAEPNNDELNAELARFPSNPDENLR